MQREQRQQQEAEAALFKRQKDAEAARYEQEQRAQAERKIAEAAKYAKEQEAAGIAAVIGRLIPVLKQTAELAGFEVVGRITLRDKETGREYR